MTCEETNTWFNLFPFLCILDMPILIETSWKLRRRWQIFSIKLFLFNRTLMILQNYLIFFINSIQLRSSVNSNFSLISFILLVNTICTHDITISYIHIFKTLNRFRRHKKERNVMTMISIEHVFAPLHSYSIQLFAPIYRQRWSSSSWWWKFICNFCLNKFYISNVKLQKNFCALKIFIDKNCMENVFN